LVPLGALVGVALVAIGIVYLVVACENLPGFLGPHAGDTSPRVGLGVLGLVLGIASLTAALIVFRRGRASGA
jgi:amino acid permease